MRQFEKEYREAMPQTIGETDRQFDEYNYTEFLERWIVKLLATPDVSKCDGIERKLQLAIDGLKGALRTGAMNRARFITNVLDEIEAIDNCC